MHCFLFHDNPPIRKINEYYYNGKDMNIRQVSLQDLQVLCEIDYHAFSKNREDSKKKIRKRILNPSSLFLGLEKEGQLVAFVYGEEMPSFLSERRKEKDFFFLSSLACEKKERGNGYGSLLLKGFEKEIKKRGKKGILLLCRKPLLSYYERHGYQNEGLFVVDSKGQDWYLNRKEIEKEKNMKIAVYLGSNSGSDKRIEEETALLGEWIGKYHHTLVYGGSNVGLMNTIASSTKKNGGKVIGVELKKFYDEGNSFSDCDEFYVTNTLLERKEKMMSLSNAFIALPGGYGTLDEISEIICQDKLSKEHKTIILLNIDGFYDDLMHQFDKMVSFGFLHMEERNRIHFLNSVQDLDSLF